MRPSPAGARAWPSPRESAAHLAGLSLTEVAGQLRGALDGATVAAVCGSTRHIVSTALTTVGGFALFLLLSGGAVWPPLAVVIAAGVTLSTTLALLLTPAAYVLLERPARAPAPVGSAALTGAAARA